MSLMPSGTPCNGPSRRPARTSSSRRRAAARAPSASTVTQAFSSSSVAAIRRRHASTRSAEVVSPRPIAATAARTPRSVRRCCSITSARPSLPRSRRLARGHLHRADELEVVIVRIGECRDPRSRCLFEVVRLADDRRAGCLETLEIALDVGALDVPDDPARLRVLAVDLVVRPNRDATRPEGPADVAALVPAGLAEQLRVVVGEALRVLGPDEDAVEVHEGSFPRGPRFSRGSSFRAGRCFRARPGPRPGQGYDTSVLVVVFGPVGSPASLPTWSIVPWFVIDSVRMS